MTITAHTETCNCGASIMRLRKIIHDAILLIAATGVANGAELSFAEMTKSGNSADEECINRAYLLLKGVEDSTKEFYAELDRTNTEGTK